MTYRPRDSSSKDCYSQSQSRLNQQIRREATDEGCPVIEESGTVCGETTSLSVFQEFRKIYDDCLKKLEGSSDGNGTLEQLAPFRNLIEDLWEQNAMLVETVKELEHEATSTVTNLQEKLNKSCQKIAECEEDIKSLITLIRRFCENGVFDHTGLQFNTVCPTDIIQDCETSFSATTDCSDFEEINQESYTVRSRPFKNSGLPICANQSIKSEHVTAKNKSTAGIPCKNLTQRQLDFQGGKNCPSPLRLKTEKVPDLLQKSFCNPSWETNCSAINKFERSLQIEDEPCERNDCQDCMAPININLNLGSDAFLDKNNSCHCNCSCRVNSCCTDF